MWRTPLRWFRIISIPLMILGVLLSTLHQSSLGSLFLLVPHKLDALWYTPYLPLFFFVSAIGVGLAMTIFESWHSSKAFNHRLDGSLLESLGSFMGRLSHALRGFGHPAAFRPGFLWNLDETMAVKSHDVVLVPKGHHPCGAPYGYEMYYLNVMAGPRRNWRFENDPDHDWIYRRDNPTT